MDLTTQRYRIHPAWWTAVLVLAVGAAMWLCSAIFAGTLTTYVPVTVTSERAGLVMEPGAKVKMRGVQVGRVSGVDGGRNQARLHLELFPDQIGYIPANAEAQIRASTAFGAKYVDLTYPEDPSPQHISAGAVLVSRNVSTEVNTVFQSLVDVLHQVDPPKLNAVLTAFADAVRGRGQRIGEATTAANDVLAALNPRMGTVQHDWRSLQGAGDAYSVAAHSLLSTFDAASVSSATVTAHSSDLDALLLSTIGLSQSGIDLLVPSRANLVKAINVLKPTTDLLSKYNPEFTCLLLGAKWSLDNGAYDAAGGDGRTIVIDDAFMFGADLYQIPRQPADRGREGRPWRQTRLRFAARCLQELSATPIDHQHWLGHWRGHPDQPRHRTPLVGELLPGDAWGAPTPELPWTRAPGDRTDSLPGCAPLRGAAVRRGRHTALPAPARGATARATISPGRALAMTVNNYPETQRR